MSQPAARKDLVDVLGQDPVGPPRAIPVPGA